ncbi:MAG TPA: polysaccharide biosynthesis tyrosine autokinase [Thermodesulfobacteriota bacterium]|nr:polysaccharide biosynthesis tyrosine autokinase [Thermodesulfobacteriota bacterium]
MEEANKRELMEYRGREIKEREDFLLSTEVRREYESYIEDDIRLKDYLDVLLRRKWIVISCLAISIVTVAIASLVMDPVYKAEATIEISPENPKITTFEEVVEVESRQNEFYETQYKLITSRSLARDVINFIQLGSHPDFSGKGQGFFHFLKDKAARAASAVSRFLSRRKEETDPVKRRMAREEELIDAFLSRLKVEPDKRSRLVQINFESSDPELTARAVNTLVDKYIEWVVERKVGMTKAARDFLDKQLQQIKIKLERAEEELGQFAKGVDIFSLENNEKLSPTYQQLVDLSEALSQAEAERFSKEAFYNEVRSGNYEFLPQVVGDELFRSLSKQYAELSAEYENKAIIYGPNYPDLKQLAAQSKKLENAIEMRVSGIAESIKKDYQAALEREKIIKQRVEEQKKLVSNLNEKAVQYRILEREVSTNKSIYENLLQRLKETEVTSGIKSTNIQVVDYASTPLVAYKPNILFNLLITTLIGLLGGVFLAFIVEHFDNTIKDEEEVKRRYSIPFLGAVPLVSDENALQDTEKTVYLNPMSIVSEAFRVIRTSILYSSPDHAPRSLLVTSTQPLEGKTTSASNLALSMVQSGLKVVLVDGDLRKPRLHKLFLSNGNAFGLSTYLVGKMELSGVISKANVEGLDLIPSGPIPPNPAELLGSRRMKELIDCLLQEYDQVIIDAPPITGFADSRLLSRSVDGVLIVTSVGITQRQPLRSCIEEILRVGGRIIGTIVNRLETGRNKYGYSYYYYYSDDQGDKHSASRQRRNKKLFLKGKVGKRKSDSSFFS